MENASRDQNFVTTLLGVSSADGTSPLKLWVDPSNHRLLVDTASGSGTVTTVSVVSANGFAGTVANATTTPAITLSTTVTGILKGNGTTISAAVSGTDLKTVNGTSIIGSGDIVTPAGTVTAVSIATANGFSGSSSGGATPALTIIAGDITPTSVTASKAGLSGSFTNSTDNASVQGLLIKGTRATPAASDEIYQSFNMNSSTGVTREFARITGSASSVTNTAEAGQIDFSVMVAGTITKKVRLYSTNLIPSANDGVALGQGTSSFSDLFLASGGVINWNNGNMTMTHAAGSLTFAGGNVLGLGAATATTLNGNTFTTGTYTLTGTAAKTLNFTNTLTLSGTDSTTMTFPSTSATIARTDAAQSFTGIQTIPQIVNTPLAATVSSNAATITRANRINNFTNSSAATMAITLSTTGALDGDLLMVRIYDFSGVAQTIGWTNTEDSTVAAPTTSNGSTTLPVTVGFEYNGGSSKWRTIAKA